MSDETTGTGKRQVGKSSHTPQARDLILNFDRRLTDKIKAIRVVEYGETDPGDEEEQDPA